MQTFSIVNRFNDRIIYEGVGECLRDVVVGAIDAGADLSWANLSRADLSGANLSRANLSGANLSRANLSWANLSLASLSGAVGIDMGSLWFKQTRILPDEGDVVGWKKCEGGVLVKLLIRDGVKRCHAFGRKCRSESADVLEVIGADVGISSHDGSTAYRKGATVVCDHWGEDFTIECSGGIHFFITRKEAEDY